MILIFCFNNFFWASQKIFWPKWGYDEEKIMADISEDPEWNLIEQFIWPNSESGLERTYFGYIAFAVTTKSALQTSSVPQPFK